MSLSRCSNYKLDEYKYTSDYRFKYFYYSNDKRVIRFEKTEGNDYIPQTCINGIWYNVKEDNWPPYIPFTSFTNGYCLVVEGENCVDSLVSRNYSALTFKTYSDWALEASISHIKDLYEGFIILPDNDVVGANKAQLVQKKLWQANQKSHIIDIQDLWICNSPIQESSDIKNLLDEIGKVNLEKLINLVAYDK